MKDFEMLGGILFVVIVCLIIVFVISKIIVPQIVKSSERKNVTLFVENYLTEKYGEHKYEVTRISYEYDMTTLFDYSNHTGYCVYFEVYFESDIVSKSWITINGLNPDDYKVEDDYFIESYYFADQDGIYKTMDNMKPKKEFETIILNELRDEFEPDVYKVECNISLNIPENYGKIPTLEELKTNTNLYKVTSFYYKVSNAIEDTNEYKERLKAYIINKYNSNSDIFFYLDNTGVKVYLRD